MTGFTVDPDSFGPLAEQLREAGTQLESSWSPVLSQSQSVQFGSGDDVVSPLIQVSPGRRRARRFVHHVLGRGAERLCRRSGEHGPDLHRGRAGHHLVDDGRLTMGIEIPGALETLLNDLGYTWPEVDESELVSLG